ncbi:MAG: carbohydrate ABC transporter substrate-binding protein, partial [Chloroflexi bacterium]|nr:carbohydrate ABC transporter substrate-binding protein [Chloroflexota bacterium]
MRTKLFVMLMLASILLAACGGATPTVAPTSAVPAAAVPPTAVPPTTAPEAITLKIYLLDYTPDTITWLKSTINPAFEAANPGVTV